MTNASNNKSKGITILHKKVKKYPHSNDSDVKAFSFMTWIETVYLFGAVFVFLFPYFMFLFMTDGQKKKYEFLPLINYSIYCACGNMYIFVRYYWNYVFVYNYSP